MELFQTAEATFYQELVDEMYDLLLNYTRIKVSDSSAALDIVQDVYLIAWEKIDRVIASPNPQGWLMNALKNYLHKYYCALADDQQMTQPLADNASDQVLLFEPADDEMSFLSVLTPQEIRIVRLKEQGYPHREIAKLLGLRPGTIDSAVSRIKAKISKFLKDEGA
ncbi:MAG: sigma-70 family RNA polymerase sigma factor [Oscillospiraceae bacterium]|jgi:RNA polymerase sigma-70 factor (ECF subfamily)|nr:sigma-70 family RNA polymerase sigma factor [Oscillospiraceae bacterium]